MGSSSGMFVGRVGFGIRGRYAFIVIFVEVC